MSEADQVKQGAAALADLFESDYERIARYIAVRIGNTGHAEELAGDVFVRALERIDAFQWRDVPMQAWLFRIAHNLVVDYLRKNSRRKATTLDESPGHRLFGQPGKRDPAHLTARRDHGSHGVSNSQPSVKWWLCASLVDSLPKKWQTW